MIPFTPAEQRLFRARLLRWYARHRRPLPWRETRDPYRIWVSEIMLQQTRVAAVLDHYAAFLRRFPSVAALARAPLDDVLAVWSGLGYYRRARSLHAAARVVVQRYRAKLPANAAELQMLPGVGRYTAAAIASIAFKEPVAVVDGNVERVLCRVAGWPRRSDARVWNTAQGLLSRRSPGNFNQAMMELGATICLPGRPNCAVCPVRELCASANGVNPGAAALSRSSLAKNGKNTRRRTLISYALAARNRTVYLVRRSSAESLMPGMWELPQLPNTGPHPPKTGRCGEPSVETPDFILRHSITITDYTVQVCRCDGAALRGGRWIHCTRVHALPLTGLTRRILRRAALI
ncbi:MAG: A/G-specific adenine glycosylase [Terriglobales bacterium]